VVLVRKVGVAVGQRLVPMAMAVANRRVPRGVSVGVVHVVLVLVVMLDRLVHVAVAWLHAGRGNPNGCERQLEKAERRLGGYRPDHRGVDVDTILEDVVHARTLVQTGSLTFPPPRV